MTLNKWRLIRSATFYYYDDEQETFSYPDAQYGAIITTITAIMYQTIKPLRLCHLGVKSQTLIQMPTQYM